MMALLLQYLAPILGIFAAIAAAFTVGHAHATAKERTKAAQQREADNEAIAVKQVNDARAGAAQVIKTVETSTDVQKSITQLDPGAAATELRDKWSRD